MRRGQEGAVACRHRLAVPLLATALLTGVPLAAMATSPPAPDARCAADWTGGVRRIAAEGLTLAWRAPAGPPPLDRHLALDVAVCGAVITGLKVDADMPAHRHGMNYRARVTPQGDGRYRAEGLLFHMPGAWQFVFDLERPGGTERLTADVTVE